MPVWSNNSNMTCWQQVNNTFKQVSMPVWGCVRRCQAGPGQSGGKVATWTSYNDKSDRTSLPFLFSSYSLTPPNRLLNLLLLYQKKKKKTNSPTPTCEPRSSHWPTWRFSAKPWAQQGLEATANPCLPLTFPTCFAAPKSLHAIIIQR